VNVLLFDPADVSAAGDVRVSGSRASHLLQVLKVTPGQTVRVGVIDGPLGTGTVQSIGDDAVELHCAFDAHAPELPRVDLLLAVPRPKVLRRLWAQLAAIGVGRIILTNAEKVERPYFDTHILEEDTYRPLLIEGLQQARDTHVPQVSIHRRFKVFVEDELEKLCGPGCRLVADPSATKAASQALRTAGAARVLLAVGPEGGWNAFEIALLEAHGFTPIGMGSRTLRTDTACVALLALVHDALGLTS